MAEVHGAMQNGHDKYRDTDRPAQYIYNSAGVNLETYIATRESQYMDLLRATFGMIDNASQAMYQYIDENWE